jgi:polyhydroxybutyrate depolymerase
VSREARVPKKLAGWSMLLLVLSLQRAATAQTNVPGSMTYGGVERSYIVHLPPGFTGSEPRPLVVALHPSLSSGANFQASSGWDAKSDQRGFVVVYPDGGQRTGSNYSWNSFDFTGGAPDDLGFLAALIGQLSSDYQLDRSRIYMTGFSNGAMMTNSFAAAHAGKVAAIAPVSGGWITAYGGSEDELQPTRAMPTWIWRGSNENFTTGIPGYSIPRNVQDQQQLAFWVNKNNAQLEDTRIEQLNYGIPRTYTTQLYAGNAPVWFTEVSGTGHVYQPGAADLIWDRFFSVTVLPEPAAAASGLLCMILLSGRRR